MLTLNYCVAPRDYLKLATPLRFPRGSPMLANLVAKLQQCFPAEGPPRDMHGKPCKEYDFVMDILRGAINKHGLRGAFQQPMVFSPVPYFAWSKPLEAGTALLGGAWGRVAVVGHGVNDWEKGIVCSCVCYGRRELRRKCAQPRKLNQRSMSCGMPPKLKQQQPPTQQASQHRWGRHSTICGASIASTRLGAWRSTTFGRLPKTPATLRRVAIGAS